MFAFGRVRFSTHHYYLIIIGALENAPHEIML